MREARGLFGSGRYLESLRKYQSIREIAQRQGDLDHVARATGNIGGCQFALHQYQPALRAFQEARRLALAAGDTGVAAVFEGNIASLYTELGNLDAAAQWMKDSLARVSGQDRLEHLAQLQIQMATLLARQKKSQAAWQYFHQGMEGADRAGDLDLYAFAWNRIGEEYLKEADPEADEIATVDEGARKRALDSAEAALLEAYRVRKLHRLAFLDDSYRNLGRLRLAQGDLASAGVLLDRAVELAQLPQGMMPTWDIYHRRGLVRLRQGRLREALDDLRVAVKLGRAWRWSAPPDQAARIGTEGWLDKVHSALIEAGNRLYLETGDGALARETFEAAEENRANSLRSLVGRANPDELPASFWEALGGLQRAEVQALRGGGADAQEALEGAHARLVSLEASLGPAYQPLPGGLLERTRRALGPDTVWFSFHLGDSNSWLWAVDRDGLALYRLPPRERIEAEIRTAATAIREDSPSADAAGEALYLTLFADLAPRFRSKSRWLLALDHELFEAPLAALRESAGGRMRYLVEGHITEVVPGAGYWLDSAERRRKPASPSLFVGIGDPIYNTADARLAAASQVRNAAMPFEPPRTARGNQAPALMLPRLVASASELDTCAHVWKGDHILLKGPAASRQELAAQLQREPAVVHFATHFLEFPGKQADSAIALGLTAATEIDLLTPEEIAHWTVRAGLVVLSGCHSAAGAVLPGTGLLGLTRAFLAAGAGAVVSSRWATPDDDGALFAALYANLGAQAPANAGRALRAAQLSMIRSGGRRARPRYWSAYFLVGNI
ncbi:MAG: CHAT domain-containing protein [Bryobacteraceae bacterium]